MNGKLFRVWLVDGATQEVIPSEVTNSFNIENALIDSSDKDSGGYGKNEDGQRTWSISITVNYEQTNTVVQDLVDKIIDADNPTDQDVLVGNNLATGDIGWSGSVKIASVGFSSENNGLVTADFELTGDSPLTKVTKSA